MPASTMPEVIAPGTDRAVALCRDVTGVGRARSGLGGYANSPRRAGPARGASCEERRTRVPSGGDEVPRDASLPGFPG